MAGGENHYYFLPDTFRTAREKGPHKLNSGNKYGGSEVFQLLRPPFSLEPVTLVAEKQGNSVFKNIPHLFGVKLGCLFMKNHQLLNSAVRKAVASLCVDVVQERESLFNSNRRRGVHDRGLQNPCESIPFSDLQCSRARRLRENCVLAKPRYATFQKIALKNAPFFTAKLCHGKGVMQVCAAGARYATFYLTISFFLTPHWVLRAPSVKWWVTTCNKVRSYANCSHVHLCSFPSKVKY